MNHIDLCAVARAAVTEINRDLHKINAAFQPTFRHGVECEMNGKERPYVRFMRTPPEGWERVSTYTVIFRGAPVVVSLQYTS